jgi:hypothetical protein
MVYTRAERAVRVGGLPQLPRLLLPAPMLDAAA